ncbi:GntR family transcriptional regulator [Oceanobacillus sp. CFH 90083]|uniref:GntR family transcriptional regulator n=1 Tax=Oceanobacillus sp. CFH 90083 TaxID=2592336 RepID=UPI001D14FE2B|nr:GntR family transcriptional regulator [Oceanobacillus sp. CFH 90083]
MTMKLNLRQGSLYLQVKDILKERIINGQYPKNSLIPSEPELEKEFEVSKITIRRAVEQLAQEGYVEKRSGIGTTVLANQAVSKLSKGQRFSEYLIGEGHQLGKQLIEVTKVEDILPSISDLAGDGAYCVERLYTLNEEPYIHFRHYIPSSISLPDDPNVFVNSLYDMLYKQGIRFFRFKDEFSVAIPEPAIAEMLEIELQPLLQRERFSYDERDKLVEYSVAYYRTDLHKYIVNFNV